MTSKHTKLQEDTHFCTLRALHETPEMSQRELAEVVGGISYMLNALIDKGLVKLENFTAAEDKRRYAYVLTPKGIARRATRTRAFRVQKMEEYESFRDEIDALTEEIGDDFSNGEHMVVKP